MATYRMSETYVALALEWRGTEHYGMWYTAARNARGGFDGWLDVVAYIEGAAEQFEAAWKEATSRDLEPDFTQSIEAYTEQAIAAMLEPDQFVLLSDAELQVIARSAIAATVYVETEVSPC